MKKSHRIHVAGHGGRGKAIKIAAARQRSESIRDNNGEPRTSGEGKAPWYAIAHGGRRVRIPEGVTWTHAPGVESAGVVNGDATIRFLHELSVQFPEHRLAQLETEFGSMSNVVRQLVVGLPTKNTLDDKVGPFRDTANLLNFLGVAHRQTIDERVKAGTLLCVRSGDGRRMYPTFQFDQHRQGLPRLAEVLDAFHADRKNAWDAALWLAQPDHDLNERTPAQALRGEDAGFVLELAHRAGAVLAA